MKTGCPGWIQLVLLIVLSGILCFTAGAEEMDDGAFFEMEPLDSIMDRMDQAQQEVGWDDEDTSPQGTSSEELPRAFVMPLEEGDTLVSENGENLTLPGEYLSIERLRKDLFAGTVAGPDGREVYLLGPDGERCMNMAFEDLFATEDYLYVLRDGKTGILYNDLTWAVACDYTQIVPNGEGNYLVLTSEPYDEQPDGVYYLGPEGEKATGIRIQYGLGSFSEGLSPVMDAMTGRMGYLNSEGNWQITAQYEYAGDFYKNIAEAAVASGNGFIDREGNWMLSPKYEAVGRSCGEHSLLLAQVNPHLIELYDPETWQCIATYEGTDICFFAGYDQDIATIYLDNSTILIDWQGNTLISCEADAVFDVYSENPDRILVRLGEYGESNVYLYDMKGNCIAGPWQEVWYLGKADGQDLYAVSHYAVSQTEEEAAWEFYSEVENSRNIQVIDADGNPKTEVQQMDYMYMDVAGNIICSSSDAVWVMDMDGNVLCRREILSEENE